MSKLSDMREEGTAVRSFGILGSRPSEVGSVVPSSIVTSPILEGAVGSVEMGDALRLFVGIADIGDEVGAADIGDEVGAVDTGAEVGEVDTPFPVRQSHLRN